MVMAEPKAEKILQVFTVAPSEESRTSATPTSLPLTFFDSFWLRFPPVERLFFYEFPHPTTLFFDSVLPKLKHSLTLTLQHFLPLAGNLTWPHDAPKPIINYVPGDGVSLTIAESKADFNHLSRTNLCEAVELQSLIPQLFISQEKAALMALQITVFPNSGFCVGITTHHAALDGKSSTSFMKSWAYICSKITESPSSSLPEHVTPFYDRAVIRDPTGIEAEYVTEWLKEGGPNNRSLVVWDWHNKIPSEAVRGTFELNPSHIQQLKQSAQSKIKKKVHLSTFAVTSAYVLSCLVKTEQTKAKRVVFIYSVDCRSRLDPPIPPTYFGNCVMGHMVILETKNLIESDGFVSALEAVSEALIRLNDGVLNGAETWRSRIRTLREEEVKIISTAGSPWFEIYNTDFGWGRPKKVEVASIDKTGAFSLSESSNGNGGVEVGLVLNKHGMEAFAALFAKGLESL